MKNLQIIYLELLKQDVANYVHYEVGKEVRNSIKRLGGTMHEDLPTPDKSLKKSEKESEKLKE